MKSVLLRSGIVIRHKLWALILLAGFSMPLLANPMWRDMFNDHLENAEAGDVDAQYEVGIMYLKGQGVAQDRAKAINWLEKAAKNGNEQAASKLGRIHEKEEKFKQSQSEAESGDLKAQYEIAMMYLKGRGVDKNGKLGKQWLTKAAEKNDAKAITRLGIVTYKGDAGPVDYPQALKLFMQVNDRSALAQYYLAEMYSQGLGVDRNYQAAIGWYKKAAAGGFDRAQGKIINLEEEIRIQALRKDKAATLAKKRKSEREAEAQAQAQAEQQARREQAAARAAAAAAQASAAKAAAPPKKVTIAKPVTRASAPEPVKLSALERLANARWLRGKKPVEYLPSNVTECDHEQANLVCFSKVLTRNRGTQTIEYRVKSIVKSDQDSFVIVYRNLVLDVTDSKDAEDDEQPLGYDDEVEKGFKIKTGWTQEHTVSCDRRSGKGLQCVKDHAHKMTLVSGN